MQVSFITAVIATCPQLETFFRKINKAILTFFFPKESKTYFIKVIDCMLNVDFVHPK